MVEIAEVVVPSVTAKEIHDRRESGESIVILDIREPDEWARGGATISGAYRGTGGRDSAGQGRLHRSPLNGHRTSCPVRADT